MYKNSCLLYAVCHPIPKGLYTTGWSEKTVPQFYFCDNFRNFTPILTFFHCYNRKCMAHKSKIMPATSPLFCITALVKHTLLWYRRFMFDLSSYWPIDQSYVTVGLMLNKRFYTNNIAVFYMFTVILPNTFDFFSTTTLIVEATVNETLWYFFYSVIIVICSNFTLLNFHPW